MATANDLGEAAALTARQAGASGLLANTLLTTLSAWNSQWTSVLAGDTPDEQTVQNWEVLSRRLQGELFFETGGSTQTDGAQVQRVIEIVARTCYAAQGAEAAGRISGADAAAILEDWNDTWGAVL
ncbi:MAG: hypothetical protein R3322_00025 [Kiloniellales bacterium]|nr:hypothetical protein [Kiloniellales bacterium]